MRLVIVGGGGCGREVLDVVDAINAVERSYDVLGVLDDGTPDANLLASFGVRHLGPTARLAELDADVAYVLGIGAPSARRRISHLAGDRSSPTLVHPSVVAGRRRVQLGRGTVVCAHTSIQSNVTIGDHVHINQNCTVGHDARIDDHCVVSPLVAISGHVSLGEQAFVGAGAVLNPGVSLGARSTVGSGAAVIADVAADTTVVGVPARPVVRRG